MLVYLIIHFILFLTFIYFSNSQLSNQSQTIASNHMFKLVDKLVYFSILFILIIFVGYRHDVGGDWIIYLETYNFFLQKDFTLYEYLKIENKEYLFSIINYFTFNYNLGIYFINIIAAFISVFFLHLFFLKVEYKYLALFILFPIFFVVCLMGFTRQGIAASIIFYATTLLLENKNFKFIFLVILASLFHISAFVALLFLGYMFKNFNLKNLIFFFVLLIISIIFIFFEFSALNRLFRIYLITTQQGYQYDGDEPTGAYFRMLPTLFFSIFLLIYKNDFNLSNHKKNILVYLSFLTIALFITSFLFVIVIDRIFYYLIFFQVIVCCEIIKSYSRLSLIFKLLIFVIYFFMHIVWLLYATHSHLWIPYKNILFL